MEILKVKLNETQTLIAYHQSESETVQVGGRRDRKSHHFVDFKVGPDSAGKFMDCSPDAALALLAMLDRQEKPPTP